MFPDSQAHRIGDPRVNLCPSQWIRLALAMFLPCLFVASVRAQAQQKHPQKAEPATPPDPAQPLWDPQRSEKSIEVGRYYFNKGNYDAAIDRFQDAAMYHPGYALPYKYLGEAQEKKGLKSDAVKSLEKYLDLYPHAEDAEQIRKHVARLRQELDRRKKKSRFLPASAGRCFAKNPYGLRLG
jgi:tetratricopeptide (TPR) repeat protein